MASMIDGEAILAAVLSLREATEMGFEGVELRFQRVEMRFERVETDIFKLDSSVNALRTRLERFEVKVLQRFDALDARLAAVEGR